MTLALVMLVGCKSKQDAAIDKAKQQAAATGQAQNVVSTDGNGNVTTTTVQPPAPGQTAQAVSTTVTPAAAVAANTPATAPGATGEPVTAGQVDSSGQPVAAPAPNEAPIVRPADINIAAGTNLTIRINQHISVKTSRAGDRFTGEVVEPVVGQNDHVVIPKGAPVSGGCVASARALQRFVNTGVAADVPHVGRVAICAGYVRSDADEEGQGEAFGGDDWWRRWSWNVGWWRGYWRRWAAGWRACRWRWRDFAERADGESGY
jgi:hypothetical protein